MFPTTRLRRLRRSPGMRQLLRENRLTMSDLIYPIFVDEGIDEPQPVPTMPGISRIPEAQLGASVKQLAAEGIQAIMLFGVSHSKDEEGRDSLHAEGLMARMLKRTKDSAPEVTLFADTCFCEYTSHGHCGVLHDGEVHNDRTLENLGVQAVVAAEAGADIVAPSGMMDGMVRAIRGALDDAGHEMIPIMSYSSKYASSFYGPFRLAAGTSLNGDRKTYQMDPANGREGLRESLEDVAEGADILMVKPGIAYLDILARLRDRSLLPLAAYQVSGEYAMIKYAAAAGALDEDATIMESLIAFKRAGADLVMTYFAPRVAALLRGEGPRDDGGDG
ncbi:MAG TPA: porphobilinogen synthase [Kiloniellaceae bacterium]|nr:porphobilinogen synthase [Kiloniellaceae bacterium]